MKCHPKPYNNERGALPILILVVAIGLVAFLAFASILSFKNNLFSRLFPKPASHAAGVVELSMSPSTISSTANGTFTVDLMMDTKTASVSAAEVHVNFDPAYLTASSITPGTFLPVVLQNGAVASGSASVILGASTATGPVSGIGKIATINFTSLKDTLAPSQINFDINTTQIAASGFAGNFLGPITGATVTIGSGGTGGTGGSSSATINISPETGNVYQVGTEFAAKVTLRSDVDAINLVAAKFNFDPAALTVTKIFTVGSFVSNWAEQFVDNVNGKVSLVGGVPAPGLKTAGSDALIATVFFQPKLALSTTISESTASAVYRNSDNLNIIVTPITSSMTITAASAPAPSPSPSIAPSAPPSSTPLPSPSPTSTPCSLSDAQWLNTVNPVSAGTIVSLKVSANGDCTGKQAIMDVLEDDNLLETAFTGTDPVKTNPPNATFSYNATTNTSTALSSWVAEYQPDGINGISDPPEYFFNASLFGGSTILHSTGAELQVTPSVPGQPLKGDANSDGQVNLQDLSILLSNWNKTTNFIDELDINSDGVINTFDFSGMIAILKANGVIN